MANDINIIHLFSNIYHYYVMTTKTDYKGTSTVSNHGIHCIHGIYIPWLYTIQYTIVYQVNIMTVK